MVDHLFAQELSKTFIKNNIDDGISELEPLTGGLVSNVFSFSTKDGGKFVSKLVSLETLSDDLFFFSVAAELGVAVPAIHNFAKVTSELGIYIMSYVVQEQLTQYNGISIIADYIRVFNNKSLAGFGHNTSLSISTPSFQFKCVHELVGFILSDLHTFFKNRNNELILGVIVELDASYEHILPNEKDGVFVHGDLSFKNVIAYSGLLYLIDPGWYRSMPKHWEAAYFESRYLEDHEFISAFRRYYFGPSPNRGDLIVILLYRTLVLLEKYKFYTKHDLDSAAVFKRLTLASEEYLLSFK